MIRRRLSGLLASLLILAIIAGMPIMLLAVGGNPIPTELPSLSRVVGWLTTPDDGTVALGAILIAGWLVWAFLTLSLITELVAAVRGIRAPTMPGLPQHAARRLVTTAALLFMVAPTATSTNPAPAHGDPAVVHVAAPAAVAAQDLDTQDVDAPYAPGRPLTPGPQAPLRDHLVSPGETLSGIAESALGDGDRWPEIYAASRGFEQPGGVRLVDPDVIDVGWTLKIPVLAPLPAASQDPEPANEPVQTPAPAENPAIPEPAARGGSASVPPTSSPAPSTRPASTRPASTRPDGPAVPTQPETTNQTSREDADRDDNDQQVLTAPWLLTGLTGGIVLSASVFLLLRSRRRQQIRERRPGRTIATPPAVLAPVEKTIHVVGAMSAPTVQYMDEALRRLADNHTTAGAPMPKVTAVELGGDGITLHLAEPSTELSSPWLPADAQGRVWRLPPDTDLTDVGDLRDYQPAPYPLLVTCGTSDDGHTWLLNLEQLATIQVVGDHEYASDFLRYIVAELAVNPWSSAATVTCVGLDDDLEAINPDRLTTTASADDAVHAILAEAHATVERIEQIEADTATARGGELGDQVWDAQALIITADHHAPILDDLIKLTAEHPDQAGVAVVVQGETATPAAVQIRVTDAGRTLVDVLGLDLIAVGLTGDEVRGCAALLAVSADTRDVPMPVDTSPGEGWQALVDQAGAIREELTIPRSDDGLAEEASSVIGADLPLPDSTIEEDLEQLDPKVPARVRKAAQAADPTLDQDLADWFSDDCPRPRLALLGPVTVAAHGKPPKKRKAFYTEVLAFIALRDHGATGDDIATAFGYTNISTIRAATSPVRDWLGINPRTGRPHLPDATKSRAFEDRGIGVYQIDGLLIDIDLFRRTRLRGQARGADGIEDLKTALRLVTGRPFDQLRPYGWSWLIDTGIEHHMVCAVVDVAHLLTTHFLQHNQIDQARQVTETALLAAPYDTTVKLDLAEIVKAEGHPEQAKRIVDEEICNLPDEDGLPSDMGERTEQVLGRMSGRQKERAAS